MILKGDCIKVMKAMKPNSVDAIVTDPPYGLEFMGKEWDKLRSVIKPQSQWGEGGWKGAGFKILPQFTGSQNFKCKKCGHYKNSGTPCKCDSPDWESSTIKKQHEIQVWHQGWLTEAYRVLKPGGSMLVMGGTRTSHRLACAIEDSGFIIKDTLMWIYGSGFPKAQDLGKMIDKRAGAKREKILKPIAYPDSDNWSAPNKNEPQKKSMFNAGERKMKNGLVETSLPTTDLAKHWDGFKVGGIKPAYEPIIWAVKPPEGSYVDNVLKWGVGAVNVDECRVATEELTPRNNKNTETIFKKGFEGKPKIINPSLKGRFPANVILSHHPECVQVGMKRVKGDNRKTFNDSKGSYFGGGNSEVENRHADETVESWDCHPDCAVRLLDEQSGNVKGFYRPNCRNKQYKANQDINFGGGQVSAQYSDNGGASRFYYCAKASRAERNAGLEGMEERTRAGINKMMGNEKGGESMKTGSGNIRNNKLSNSHPTVKPIKLFEWLIKLVTREGQIILDPFIGSGTTAIAAHNIGRKYIGIEKEGEYLKIAKKRIIHWESQARQIEMRI